MGYTVGLFIKEKENLDIIYEYLKNKFKDTLVEKHSENDVTLFQPNIEISYGSSSFIDPDDVFSKKNRQIFDLLIFYISEQYGHSVVFSENPLDIEKSSTFYTYDGAIQLCKDLEDGDQIYFINQDGSLRIMNDTEIDYYFEQGNEKEIKDQYLIVETIYNPYTQFPDHAEYNTYMISDFMTIENKLKNS